MIIFYNETTGEIRGSIKGRTHTPEELKMWIGDPKEVGRIVCNWVIDPEGNWFPEKQKDMFEAIESDPQFIQHYKVDIRSLLVNEMTPEEQKARQLKKTPAPKQEQPTISDIIISLQNRVTELEKLLKT